MLIEMYIIIKENTEYWCFIVTYCCHVYFPETKDNGGWKESSWKSVELRSCACNLDWYLSDIWDFYRTTYLIPVAAQSKWHGSSAAPLLGLWASIPLGAWLSFSCESCVLSGEDLCIRLVTCPEESYRMLCAWVWSWSLDNEEALAYWDCNTRGSGLAWMRNTACWTLY